MDLENFTALAVFFGASFAAATAGAIFKPGEWFESLNHPSWRFPNWVFPVVWTPLYILIALSGYFVWREAGWSGAALPLTVYGVHLVINWAWSWVFFGLRRIDWAMAEVVLLWLSIAATIAVFWPISQTAALMLLPYLGWVTIASVLNWTMWQLNPGTGEPRKAG